VLRVGVVGPLAVDVPRVAVRRGALDAFGGLPLVLVSARSVDLPSVAAAAAAHPDTHYAYVGRSTKGMRRPNLVGVVFRDAQAASLAGMVTALVLEEQGGTEPRAAWVGPVERPLADAFAQGIHRTVPSAVVLHGWSRRDPARCKEAALATLARGAVVVAAHGGLCAEAAAAAAHEHNRIAVALTDFELPRVAVATIVREAAGDRYHGGEDLVFGAASGAVGIRRLDPRISSDVALRARAAAQELAGGLRPTG